MPKLKRVRRGHDEEWQQLELRLTFPEQRVYELIRPVVLYGLSPAERARETGAAELDRAGYVQFRRWKIYGEYGLARQTATIWLTVENLTITFQDQPLAHYAVSLSVDQKRLTDIREPQLVESAFRSLQLHLWALSDEEWRKVVPPKHLRPLSLWERGADGVVQIIPSAPTRHRRPSVSLLVQAAFAL